MLRLQEEKTQEAEARLRQEKKSARRKKMFLGAVSVGFVISTLLGVVAFLLFGQATKKEHQVVQEEKQEINSKNGLQEVEELKEEEENNKNWQLEVASLK